MISILYAQNFNYVVCHVTKTQFYHANVCHECFKMMIVIIEYLLHEIKGRGILAFSTFQH
jgi:hypothetical protein